MAGFDYFATGPRMGLAVALALESTGILESLHIDAWLQSGRLERIAEWAFGPRARNRVIRGIDPKKIHAHPELFVLGRLARRAYLAGTDTKVIDRLILRDFETIARRCSSAAVFGMQSCSLELFQGRDCRIIEQFAAPAIVDRRIAQVERQRFEGWTHERVSRPTPLDDRNIAEWEHADIIWVPSPHLIALCEQYGADRKKMRVVRYPIPEYPRALTRQLTGDRPLRVIFAGTLMLRKGVQYIYEALRDWNPDRIDMHFFGENQLTAKGTACLAKVGKLHGPIARAELLDEFARSDVLLFPSLSEGSALVMAEAAATGLPAIATRESGPLDSAILIEARDPGAIRAALSRILDDPDFLHTASQTSLSESRRRTDELFKAEIGALATEAFMTRIGNR